MCALIGEVSQAVSIAVVTTNCEIVSRTHSSEEVFVMEMERRGEQSISSSMSRVAGKATPAVTKWVKDGRFKRGGKERTHGNK
ncbi:hypothetical protein [Ruminococcus sp.]|uniref:hypothetical protein n=1 Tax=Ruminococcus sp. TaxID=41978 RepID=UPI0025E4E966|nr:hypothetical protein [Ruminococcus sp.]